jgi:hypothetical protein
MCKFYQLLSLVTKPDSSPTHSVFLNEKLFPSGIYIRSRIIYWININANSCRIPAPKRRSGKAGHLIRIANPVYCCASRPLRPKLLLQQISQYTYFYSAFCPETGDVFSLILPYSDTDAMQVFIEEFSKHLNGKPALLFTGDTTIKKFYNFLNSGKLPWDALWGFLAGIMGDPTVDGRLLIGLDDTTYGKTGKDIAGCASHFDYAAKKNFSKWIFGHCRVLAGLLLFGNGRWACLPFAQKLYMPLPKTVKSSAKLPHAEWLKTKSGIGELVIRLVQRFKRPVLIVCDSWFGTKPLLMEVRDKVAFGVHILSRLRISAILYYFPEIVSGKRGRLPKFGRQLATVKFLSAQLRQSARSAIIHIYGKDRKVEFAELLCVSKAFGYQVKVVFVYYKGFAFPLVTTDITLTAEQMIEFYSARWNIESGFKEIKQDIGAIDSQCRKPLAVENHFDLCCFAMSLTWIYAFKLDHAPAQRHPGKRTWAFAFADIRPKISDALAMESILQGRCHEGLIPAVKFVCLSIFRWAS